MPEPGSQMPDSALIALKQNAGNHHLASGILLLASSAGWRAALHLMQPLQKRVLLAAGDFDL